MSPFFGRYKCNVQKRRKNKIKLNEKYNIVILTVCFHSIFDILRFFFFSRNNQRINQHITQIKVTLKRGAQKYTRHFFERRAFFFTGMENNLFFFNIVSLV